MPIISYDVPIISYDFLCCSGQNSDHQRSPANNRGPMGGNRETNYAMFCLFLHLLLYFLVLGIYINSKWLIKVPGHIPIVFWMISGTSKILLKYGPVTLLTITNMTQKYKNKYGIISKLYYFHI